MKKFTYVIVVIAVVLVTRFAFAEEMKDSMMGKGMMGKGMMADKGMMMQGMMMHAMMNKSMVATSDGGVIVMAGNTLTKYDKDLNAVKEVDIKMNMDSMQKMMTDMMEKGPMMGKGAGMGMKDNDNDDDDKAEAAPASVSSGKAPAADDHASHH